MINLLTFLILTVCLMAILVSQGMLNFKDASLKKFIPQKKKLTMFDVREKIVKGEKDKAVQMYCQIFSVSRKDAQKAVDELERSIQEKNFEV